jgi:predicted SAM-dependent methyltransferase
MIDRRTEGATGTRGSVDYCDEYEIAGWAVSNGHAPAEVHVSLDGEDAGATVADRDRPDLGEHDLPTQTGFLFEFPTPLTRDCTVEVTVGGVHLDGSPWSYRHCADPVGQLYYGKHSARGHIAEHFLVGEGIEIGALHQAVSVSERAKVTYVDRLPIKELWEHYPELRGQHLIEPDVLDDGQRLETFADDSQDFIIANHFLEHTEDPIACIRTWSARLKPGGTIFLAVPDKNYNVMDCKRDLTPLDHLRQDHELGPEYSRRTHYMQWVGEGAGKKGQEMWHEASRLDREHYSIHFHTWTSESFLEFIGWVLSEYHLPLTCDFVKRNDDEIICVLHKL